MLKFHSSERNLVAPNISIWHRSL